MTFAWSQPIGMACVTRVLSLAPKLHASTTPAVRVPAGFPCVAVPGRGLYGAPLVVPVAIHTTADIARIPWTSPCSRSDSCPVALFGVPSKNDSQITATLPRWRL